MEQKVAALVDTMTKPDALSKTTAETLVCTENSDSHVVVMQSAEQCL
jgi:hypothetical protein